MAGNIVSRLRRAEEQVESLRRTALADIINAAAKEVIRLQCVVDAAQSFIEADAALCRAQADYKRNPSAADAEHVCFLRDGASDAHSDLVLALGRKPNERQDH